MKTRPSSSSSAFTLIEVITAMAVILILTGLVLQISGYVTNRGSKARATAEISMLSTACESYKADAGTYPQDLENGLATPGKTDKLKPKEHFNPTGEEYEKANRFLYEQLTGDKNRDGIPGDNEARYLKEFDVKMLKVDRDVNGKITEVKGIGDPFGYHYGYSTAAAREEMLYLQRLKQSGAADNPRPSVNEMPGFNSATFDMWSTGGSKPQTEPNDDKKKQLEWAKWVKNW